MPTPLSRTDAVCDLVHAASTFAFGIEEEFFLSDRVSRRGAERMPPELLARLRERHGARVSSELLQGQIEVSTPICYTAADARAALATLRGGVAEEARPFGLVPVAAGTHPLADWRQQSHSGSARHVQLMDDFRVVAQRNLLCGTHVHVATPDGVDRIVVMNRVLPWLPLLLALSTSSPFWNGEPTGLASYRQAAYDEWPRSGIPDHFADEADYARFVERLVDAGALSDAASIWWAIRPSHRYPTLEFRIFDQCTELEESVCLAQLARALVRMAVLEREAAPADGAARLIVDENRWRAKRYGMDATFIDLPGGPGLEAAQSALERLLVRLAPHAAVLGCETELQRTRAIARRGTSASRQVAVFDASRSSGAGHERALQAVVDDLAARTTRAVTETCGA